MDFFYFYDIIGSGMTCVVFRARFKPDDSLVAVKFIQDIVKNRRLRLGAMTEISVLKLCAKCPFIVKYHSHFRVENNLYIVTNIYRNGDIANLINPKLILPASLARIYVKDICMGLFFLHKHKVAHRDLNPNNVIIGDDGHPRLIDFSCARSMKSKDSERFTDLGNPAYKAPEVYLDQPCALAVDWWAVGVLLYRFVCGTTPFCEQHAKMMESYQKVTKLKPKYPQWAFADKDLLDICYSFLEKNPAKRLGSVHAVHAIQSHPYFNSVDWDMRENIMEIINNEEDMQETHTQLYNKLIKMKFKTEPNLPEHERKGSKVSLVDTTAGTSAFTSAAISLGSSVDTGLSSAVTETEV